MRRSPLNGDIDRLRDLGPEFVWGWGAADKVLPDELEAATHRRMAEPTG